MGGKLIKLIFSPHWAENQDEAETAIKEHKIKRGINNRHLTLVRIKKNNSRVT